MVRGRGTRVEIGRKDEMRVMKSGKKKMWQCAYSETTCEQNMVQYFDYLRLGIIFTLRMINSIEVDLINHFN